MNASNRNKSNQKIKRDLGIEEIKEVARDGSSFKEESQAAKSKQSEEMKAEEQKNEPKEVKVDIEDFGPR